MTRRIIPCLDVTDGRVVKGISFVKISAMPAIPSRWPPSTMPKGLTSWFFSISPPVPIAASTMIDVVRRTADQIYIPLTVGGGIRSVADMRQILQSGADKVSTNTAAIARPRANHRRRRDLRQPGDRRRH